MPGRSALWSRALIFRRNSRRRTSRDWGTPGAAPDPFFPRPADHPAAAGALCRTLWHLHVHPIYPVLADLPEIMLIDTHPGFLPDNDNWHTDVTFSQTPPMAGILAAKRLPSAGGDTLWSSCSAVYETLSDPMQRFLEGLTAQHSVAKSFPAERWANDPASKERYERAVAKHPPVFTRWCARIRLVVAAGCSSTRASPPASTSWRAGEPGAAELPVRAGGPTRTYDTLELECRRRGVLGQPHHSALRDRGLPAQAARHAPRDRQRRPPVLGNALAGLRRERRVRGPGAGAGGRSGGDINPRH